MRGREGRLEGIHEETFRGEDDLQALIAEHPELIDGEQIRPDDARRWILIAREKGIAETADTGARWALDHLIIDQDARPTLVEVKLHDNSDIHRKIVGQMLEYAAHASETWTADDLRRTFEESERRRDRDPDEVLAELLLGKAEPDPDRFWDRVSTNLAAKRLRLLFIADRIPDRLARVVEFLNSQMRALEVLAVEVKRFRGSSGEMFVPRVIGRTAKATDGTSGAQSPKLTRESFLAAFEHDRHREAAARLLDAAERSGAGFRWVKHLVSVTARCSVWAHPVTIAWLCPPTVLHGWPRWTRGVTYGTKILEDEQQVNAEVWEVLAQWADRSSVPYAEEAHAKGYEGWTVNHDVAADHIDDLVEKLENVLKQLSEL
ncbi:hypothetical protein [Candidatus Palauibacter sp.]|uniref:hypothetical protein n=1 Tax=Candidatus Palauibacter sp. TaxID=3101350 RepID=UPI003B5CE03C